MNKALFVLLCGLGAAQAHAGAGSDHGGNGGDAVYCTKSPKNPYNGYHALDQVLSARKDGERGPKRWVDKMAEIRDLSLGSACRDASFLPECATLNADFREFTRSYPAGKGRYEWKPAEEPLSPIHDEKLLENVPANCRSKGIIQAVRRVKIGDHVKFLYDRDVLEKLERSGNRLTWILVHEWLWNTLDHAEAIRTVNAALQTGTVDPSEGTAGLINRFSADKTVLPLGGYYVSAQQRDCAIRISPPKNPESRGLTVAQVDVPGSLSRCNPTYENQASCYHSAALGQTVCHTENWGYAIGVATSLSFDRIDVAGASASYRISDR